MGHAAVNNYGPNETSKPKSLGAPFAYESLFNPIEKVRKFHAMMLKRIPAFIDAELLWVLASMGHGDVRWSWKFRQGGKLFPN